VKILQVISGRNVNGAVTYCKFLSEQLMRLGHQVSVLCRPDGWLQANLPPQIEVFESDLSRSPFELQRVSKWIREQQFDVIHSHMSRAHSFGVLMRLMTRTPVVATAHQCSLQLHWRMNDRVIANSAATADYQLRINRVAPSRLRTIHCFTDLDRFLNVPTKAIQIVRNEMRLRESDFVIGVVGDVLARKGQLYLFRAMSEIIAAVPNCKLVLVGRFNRSESYIKRLRQIQKQSPLINRVKWLGLRNNVQDFMAAFDLCVVPSISEPLGLVALESLATGTPVVASATGGLPEIVEHGQSGLLVPPKNPHELAAAVIKLARDAKLRAQMGQNGRSFVRENFDPTLLARSVEAVFRELSVRKKRAA
jgi:glycosyltransferase involved in cell wall biosynthesis